VTNDAYDAAAAAAAADDDDSSGLSHSVILGTTNLVCSSTSRIHIITLLHLYFSVATVSLSTLCLQWQREQ
jgi:hypothetical protein